MRWSAFGPPCLLTAFALCSPATAAPIYELETLISVPASPDNTVGGKFTTYDIAFFDGTTQNFYLADRSNAAVDIFSAATNSFTGRVGGSGGHFAGIQPPQNVPNPPPANNDISGPNGVLVVNQPGQHVLWAGDGNSTLKGFNLNAGNAQLPGTPIATGTPADKRVDEMAFSPANQRLIVANNAADVPFATLINTSNNTIAQKIVFDGTNGAPKATNGIEQAVWEPITQKFYISIPQINGSGPGAVAAIDPNSGLVLQTFDLAAFGIGACGPTGLASNAGGQLMVGCGDPGQSILFDPKANGGRGAVVKTFAQVSGEDMVWFDPKTGRFYLAARNNPGGPVLGVIDGTTDEWLLNIPTTPGDHSVAADPVSGEVFVPFGGIAGNTVCPNGCIAVYREVPEPGTLAVLAVSLFGFASMTRRRRRP